MSTPAEPRETLERRVAVLIMIVTLVGAFVAFLQTQAGNRESSADRSAQTASVSAMTSVVEANRRFTRLALVYDAANDQEVLRKAYAEDTGPASPYSSALASVYGAGAKAVSASMADLFGSSYGQEGGGFDVVGFFEAQLEPGYREGELEKAYARERDHWGSKGTRFVTVITIFALALFLLGLTLTVPGNARRLFFWAGCAVAAAAAIWGTFIWVSPVERPSEAAIDAYVEGQAKSDVTDFLIADPKQKAINYQLIAEDFSRAIGERSDYAEAFLGRGTARFALDLQRAEGPQGSDEARADFERATELDRDNFVAWGDLGAAHFWLEDYEAALESTARALNLESGDTIFNMNRALFLICSDRDSEYQAQMRRVREVLARAPSWLRDLSMVRYDQVIAQALGREQIADKVEILRRDLREAYASLRTVGEAEPASVEAELTEPSFTLTSPPSQGGGPFGGVGAPKLATNAGATGGAVSTFVPPGAAGLAERGWVTRDRLLKATIFYKGIGPEDRWLLDTYVNGQRVPDLSIAPEKWRFKRPSGRLALQLPGGGRLYGPGAQVRSEIFIGGNLLAAVEYEYDSAASP